MDYYKFINSKDIQAYLREIKYEFSTMEKAYVVWQSDHVTIKEKLDAFQYIIKNEEDCVVKKRYNLRHYRSLKELIQKYMSLINHLIDEFYSKKGGFVYSAEYTVEEDKDWCDFDFISQDYQTLKDYVVEELKEDHVRGIRIKKTYFNVERKYLTLHFNKDLEIVDVDCGNMGLKESEWDIYSSFQGMWFSIPTPFKKGDVLTFIRHPFQAKYDSNPFVLRYICDWDYDKFKKDGFDDNGAIERKSWNRILNIHRKNGDDTDMYIAAYFLGDDYFYPEVEANYLDVEYYRGKYEGNERIMHTLSLYIKGEIDLYGLQKAILVIKQQDGANEELRYFHYNDEALKMLKLCGK